MVNTLDKNCYSYCFFGDYCNRKQLEKIGIDIDYWNKKFGYKSSYEGLTLTDIFTKLLPSGATHWKHMRHIIGCDIDWDEHLFRREEKSLDIFERVEKYIRLTTDKFKTTI